MQKRNSLEKYVKYISQIIKLQARYRGFLARKRLPPDVRSTLNAISSRHESKMTARVKRPGAIEERTYADGAKYKGNWR